MILQHLEAYYLRLADGDGESLVVPGFSQQNITFCVELDPGGGVLAIRDVRDTSGKKTTPRKMKVLGSAKPSGSGLNPCFLWDNSSYLLGFKADDDKPDRTRQAFEAFRDRHLGLQLEMGDPEFDAVCEFLKSWDPSSAGNHEILKEISTGFGVFQVGDHRHFVHESPRVLAWWQTQLGSADESASNDEPMQCLVSGVASPIARIHEPKIQGVNGAQSAGALLVSFNFDASESYGREQSFVAPVSKESAFRYAVALNRLLDRGGSQRMQVGDATVVFWTDKKSPIERAFLGLIDSGSVQDEVLKRRLREILQLISRGKKADELGDEKTMFFVLGLSPNAARLSVRFWWKGTVGEVTQRLAKHFDDLSIVKPPNAAEFPSLWQILRETARESKDIPPNLSGSVMRAILYGTDYPLLLFQCVLRRIKADGEISPLRAASIKACLNRTHRLGSFRSPLSRSLEMSLNKDRPESAYQLGRLFAALEKTQEDAFKGSVNASIKDRFFSAASATPAVVFPRLIRMNQHHVGKLESKAYQINAERRTQEIMANIDRFPKFLSMPEQGLFAIGYYHQRQDFFTKKVDDESISKAIDA